MAVYYREGAMVSLAGADANGMTGVDGIPTMLN